jgi:fluoride exporter
MNSSFWPYAWIAVGSAIGGMGRYGLNGLISARFEQFPLGTLLVNISGSLIIGIIAAVSAPEGRLWLQPQTREFLMIGLLGGYTTFSSFSLQTLFLARDGEWLMAGANIVGSVVLCLLAVWLGFLMGELFNRWR